MDRVSNNSTSTTTTTTFFPLLKQLMIHFCKKLKGLWKRNDDQVSTTTEKAELSSFPCLSQLNISIFPMLTFMPLYPTSEKLYLSDYNTRTLQQIMMMKTSADAEAAAPSTSYSAPVLSNLKALTFRSIDDLESPPELLQRVSCLVEIDTSRSPILISQLPQCLRYLSSLEQLTIGHCDQLDFVKDDDGVKQSQWQGLKSLPYLKFDGVRKWIHHITTLQHLLIYRYSDLIGLPEGMQL